MIENLLQKELEFNFAFANYLFRRQSFNAEDAEVVNFLTTKLSFYYNRKYNEDNPFVPFASFVTGERSAVFEDLTDENFNYISYLLTKTEHPLIKGRFFDILAIHFKNKDMMLNSAKNYYDYFIGSMQNTKNYNLSDAFKRSMFLFWRASKKMFWEKIDDVYKTITYKDFDQKIIVYYTSIKILQEVNQKLKQEHIDIIETQLTEINDPREPVLEIIKELASHYKQAHNNEKAKFWRLRFADICIAAGNKFRHGYKFLQQAIDFLDKQEDIEKINNLRFLLEKSQKKAYNEMQFLSLELDNSILNDLKKYEEVCDKIFNNCQTGSCQFLYFLKYFNPISMTELKKAISVQKNSLSAIFCNNMLFDENGLIIYESSTATPAENDEFQFSQAIQQHLPFSAIVLNKWQKYRKIDNDLKAILHDITSHNLLIPKERIKTVYDIIIRGLSENKFRQATFELIVQFENGCRTYLKDFCNIYPIFYKGNNLVSIDINHMLVQKTSKANNNRNRIVEVIGEDLALNIEYLACRKMSGNLRNRNYHYGFDNPDEYNIYEYTLFFLLIKAYCMGYDYDVN
ncbi:MAG: hypothetical protein SPH68_01230 [Candidatus Borkfalkiaceae bacterium]|nr:hypothetical protein [Clostridia bacterium]MDY6222767.1 hypothetical protein [Christensenellaceae bacterium]